MTDSVLSALVARRADLMGRLNQAQAAIRRLALSSRTLINSQNLDFLVSAYPDHGFVIDRSEAKAIFRDVREPTDSLCALALTLGDRGLYPARSGLEGGKEFLSSELPSGDPPNKAERHGSKAADVAGKQPPKRATGASPGRKRGSRALRDGATRPPNRTNGRAHSA